MNTEKTTRFRTQCPNCKAVKIDEDMTQSLLKIPHKKNCTSMKMNVKTKYFIEEYLE